MPGRVLVPADKGKRNSHMISAFNHYMHRLYEEIGITIVRAWTISIPWSEELVQGRTHLITTESDGFLTTPPGDVSTHLLMLYACEGDVT